LAGIIVLGAVFLVVTGGEALYADMGHFGARPIRLAWFVVALPALLINYFGQGAMILRDPSTASAPLFRMVPDWGLYPLIVLATAATIIASQAVISGTYSITGQAIMLGYAPRMTIEHTSSRKIGQIYMPTVNWGLLVVVLLLVVGFGSSSKLAAAYGIAVTSTMLITTILAYVVARRVWGWSRWLALPLTAIFLLIDIAFLGANSLKIAAGGWFPLVLAAAVFVLMSTWKRGREILAARLRERAIAWDALPGFLEEQRPARPAGTGVYMTSSLDRVPPALLDNVRHNHTLHDRVILLSIEFTQTARVSVKDRLVVEQAPGGFLRIRGRYGFTEHPDVPSLLKLAIGEGIDINVDEATFVLGRETILATERSGMAIWRDVIFAFMSRNAGRAAAYFGIPSDQVLEIGSQIEL
jgi:KUP system potassium uptake protein